jgi:ankyrin repeat protein
MELEIWSQLDKRDESNAVRLLRDHYDEIDVNLLFRGYTMLHMACIWGHNKAIKLLLAHPGIDVNLPDSSGLTPLHIACYNARIEIVKLLLADERVDKNVKGFKNNTYM